MPRRTQMLDLQDPEPVYVRWNPENSIWAIELRLDLVTKILEETALAAEAGAEAGGILLGTLPDVATPTLRIDELQMIPRKPGQGPVFLLDPREQDRLFSIRRGNRVPVGLFRTHTRQGPLQPSLADRTLLAGRFDTRAYVLLLIDAGDRHTAVFFVGSKGDLSEQPSVAPFHFEPSELGALPEIDRLPRQARLAQAPARSLGAAIAVLILAVAAASYLWWGIDVSRISHATDANPHLTLSDGNISRIAWDTQSPSIRNALGAKLAINENGNTREISLSPTDLRTGAVEYPASRAAGLRVTLTLEMPGGYLLVQSAT